MSFNGVPIARHNNIAFGAYTQTQTHTHEKKSSHKEDREEKTSPPREREKIV